MKLNKKIKNLFLAFAFTLLGCQAAMAAIDNTKPSVPVKLVFIHHSTGGFWLADTNPNQTYGGLASALMANNYYVSATNYGWGPGAIGDNTDIIYWPDWFTRTNSSTILTALYSETGQNFGDFGSWQRLSTDPGGENRIIMFKSCFPNSNLSGNPTDQAETTPNDQFTVSNAKAVYNNILSYFRSRPDKLFVVITAPPQNQSEYNLDAATAASRAANARAFNNWLLNEWLVGYPYKNVAVFDYFNVLTGTDNHHRWLNNTVQHVTADSNNFAAYPTDSGDSHPNTAGQTKATEEFVGLLNFFYNTWRSDPASVSASEKVNIRQMTLSPTGTPQAGSPVTVSVTASNSGGSQVYYKFYYCANYGSASYDTTPWTVVQDYSTNSSASYVFPTSGNYIIVARAVLDPSNEPAALPIIGQSVFVADSNEVAISGISSGSTTNPNAGEAVTFSVTATAPSGAPVYYKFYYRPDYGTSSYDSAPWTTVRDYSTESSCQYIFPSAGNYVAVARAVKNPSSEPATLPITGLAVSVNDNFRISSSSFTEGGTIPVKYTCNGQDMSPSITFSGIPANTRSFALICDDPDAGDTFVHWVLFNIPTTTRMISEGIPPESSMADGSIHGINDFGHSYYGGPCPPSGVHRYYFKAYALDTVLNLNAGATKTEVLNAMSGHILAQDDMMGTYGN